MGRSTSGRQVAAWRWNLVESDTAVDCCRAYRLVPLALLPPLLFGHCPRSLFHPSQGLAFLDEVEGLMDQLLALAGSNVERVKPAAKAVSLPILTEW